MKDAQAVVVLPAGAFGRIADARLRRWLSRGRIWFDAPRCEMLVRVLSAIDAPAPEGGLAALRFWGQADERSAAWIAAADPVHLQTRLRDLRVRALSPPDVPRQDIRAIFESLQRELGDDTGFAFTRLGDCGYLRGETQIATPGVSAAVADGHVPDRFTPAGEAGRTYHQLIGEVQMFLHGHEVNLRREEIGLPAINSLWFWGGGLAPERTDRPVPPLFSSDPLFRGYWKSCAGSIESWHGGFEGCISDAPNGFVAVPPDTAAERPTVYLEEHLRSLSRLMKTSDIQSLTLLFRDGLGVAIGRLDRARFWRGISALLDEQNDDG